MRKRPCRQGFRCRDYLNCESCALSRAYDFANKAYAGIPENARITYAVIRPEEQAALEPLKKQITRWSARNAIGHCWTVETGQTAHGLHLNIILANDTEIKESAIIKAIGTSADIWANQISRHDFKKIARYINKQKSMPTSDQYGGKLMGRSGVMLNPIAFLARSSTGVASLIAQEQILFEAGMPPNPFVENKPILKHLPTVARVLSRPHDYEPFAIDMNGNVINNPNYKEPNHPYTDIRKKCKT